MINLLSPVSAVSHLFIFTALMIAATIIAGRKFGNKSLEGFLVVDRQVPWWLAGPSITASWTWAVALLISVQMAYQQGLAGIFWFTVPNVVAVLIYIWLGPRIRERLPKGYSLPEWMNVRFGNRGVTFLYLFVYFFYQVMAVTVQVYAGAQVLSVATGISSLTLMPTVLIITWAYALISGMEASIVTDVLQTALMLIPGWLIVALVVHAAHGQMTLTGVDGGGSLNPFSLKIFLTAGVINSIALLSGAIGDQQFWQRCLAIRKTHLRKSFVFAALLFASIPISLSLLGFTAAAPGVGLVVPPNFDASLIGFAIVKHLLAPGLAVLYLYMILAGLCSTLDSGLSAASALYPLVHARFWQKELKERPKLSIGQARIVMVVLGLIGLALSYLVEFVPGFGLKYLFWFLNTIGACVVVPTVLSLFWDRLTARGILIGSIVSLILGLPLIIYGSITANDYLLAATYVGIVICSAVTCVLTRRAVPEPLNVSV